MRFPTVRSPYSIRLAAGLLALLAVPAGAQVAAVSPSCVGVPPGGPCQGTPDPVPNDCQEPRCIEGHCELNYPSPGGTPCDDQDGNPCTAGACIQGVGKCGAQPVPDGTVCPDSDKDLCTVFRCQEGKCQDVGPAAASMDDVASVEVEARPARVEQDEAFCDCCVFCEEQSLEALRPSASGPERVELDGGLPLRRKFCGTVVRYGVNDERDDPRDIMLNIVPSPGFEPFVAGYVNTECTALDSAFKKLFAQEDSDCPVGQCLAQSASVPGKCIHAEITPAEQYYKTDFRFLPISGDGRCGDGWDCDSSLEPAGEWTGGTPPGGQPGQEGRQVCVYGVYAHDHGPDHRAADHRKLCCSPDASHDRPEIHPFDAVWFLQSGRPGWTFAVFQDDSNRYSFPHCGSQHNGNTWSQGPRDLTFRFPFRFPRTQTPLKACLHHGRTTSFAGADHNVLPVNVTTKLMPDPLTEVKTLQDGSAVLLEAVEHPGLEDETQVRIEGCVTPTEIKGVVIVRVAVGCPQGTSCPSLSDPGDPGSGFYFGDLFFQRDCSG